MSAVALRCGHEAKPCDQLKARIDRRAKRRSMHVRSRPQLELVADQVALMRRRYMQTESSWSISYVGAVRARANPEVGLQTGAPATSWLSAACAVRWSLWASKRRRS